MTEGLAMTDNLHRAKPMALVEIRDVHKSFQRDSERIEVFTGLTLDIEEGSFTALMGPSGSGQIHPAQPRGRTRQADQRQRCGWRGPR